MIVTHELNNWLEWLNKRIPELRKDYNRIWLIMAMNGYVENLNMNTCVSTAIYDCDSCKNFPCSLQTMGSDPNKKLRLNECGDFKPIKCEHENIEQGTYPDKPPICKDCGEEV